MTGWGTKKKIFLAWTGSKPVLKLKASPNTSDTALHKYIRCTGENPQKTLQGLQGQDQQSKLEPTHEDRTGLYLSEQNKNDYFTTQHKKKKVNKPYHDKVHYK